MERLSQKESAIRREYPGWCRHQTGMLKRPWFQNLLLAAFVLGGVWFWFNRTASRVEAHAAPEWELFDLNGNLHRSKDFEGKVVVLNFWATWCPPCRMEIPGFVEVQAELEDAGLVIVGISLDEAPVAQVRTFAEDFGINYPVVMGDAQVANDYEGVRALPTTFFIDREGQVRNVHRGYMTKRAFRKTVLRLL